MLYSAGHHLGLAGGHAPGAATRWGTTILTLTLHSSIPLTYKHNFELTQACLLDLPKTTDG